MNGDLTILVIGATIGILGSIVGYCLNHLLKLREQKVVREFEIREKGREFFHQIYGFVARLSDFATSILRENGSGNTMVLIESGYTMQPTAEIIKRYKEAYKEHAGFWYETRKQGREVFLPKDLARNLAVFWAHAGYFYTKDNWSEEKKLLADFEATSTMICENIDKLLGLSEKKSSKEKWLNPRKWRYIIRGKDVA